MKIQHSDIQDVRVDRWLWSVRIFKTRAMATDKCKRGHVTINGQKVKASRKVKIGETLNVKKDGFARQFCVLGLISKRVGAKLAGECVKELTSEENLKTYAAIRRMPVPWRLRGTGRPTKKDRRELDRLKEG
jgi:ribosome-associated heat shock protein Hsp15